MPPSPHPTSEGVAESGSMKMPPSSASSAYSSMKEPSKKVSNYDVIKLLKQSENRLCADCQAPLTNSHHTYAAIDFGVWVCLLCADTHRNIFPHHVETIKSAEDSWLLTDITKMQAAKSNVHQNVIFERYLPSAWPKIHATSPYKDRKSWIRAKYYSHYFMIPQLQEQPMAELKSSRPDKHKSADRRERQDRIEQSIILPTRIVDYFLTVNINKMKKYQQLNYQKAAHGKDTIALSRNVEDWIFSTDLRDVYPHKPHADTPIPELVGSMVFPHGLRITTTEHPPYCFSFVLTDINRVKLYGTTLIVYELLEPSALLALLPSSHHIENLEEVQSILQSKVFYCPKALTVLSHYSFYNLYQLFLTQLYHLSLSVAKLPLERYVVNFMTELPLPPQGRVEVIFNLPEYVLHVSRPPKNQLPMVDFSYQPLFSFLSVDHILLLVKCLCLEMTIAICCSNVSLLTPIQEGLLSALYPFIWQGCYVPILPDHMYELLDAPVPLLVGISDQYLLTTNEEYRPSHVVFVHVDKDEIHLGGEALQILGNTQLPKSKVSKLKSKLQEASANLYDRKDKASILQSAGYPFPHNEHLAPINKLISEHGVVLQNQSSTSTFSTSQLMSSLNKLGVRRASQAPAGNTSNTSSPVHPSQASSNGGGSAASGSGSSAALSGYEAVPYRHPAACALITSSVSSPHLYSNNFLNAENNFNHPSHPAFNAKEIREAFLRFFVASFTDYQEYFRGEYQAGRSVSKAGDDDEHDDKSFFDKAGFKHSLQDDFLARMVDSQMFSNFLSEKHDFPNQSEIVFFDENILAKKNRSKLLLAKSSTPFLSDDRDFLREAFTAPLPSTASVQVTEAGFTYTSFPTLQDKWYVAPRNSQCLVGSPEVKRLQDLHNNAMTYLQEQLMAMKKQSTVFSSTKTNLPPGMSSRADSPVSAFTSLLDESLASSASNEEFFEVTQQRFEQVLGPLRVFQAYCHWTRPLRKRFLRLKAAKIVIWRAYRHFRFLRQQRYKRFLQHIIKMQTWYRMCLGARRYRRFQHAVRVLQASVRRRKCQLRYRYIRRKVIQFQAFYRAQKTRRQQQQTLTLLFTKYRQQIVYLWCLEHTSLRYRSYFYLMINDVTYVHIALYKEELQRLYYSLHLQDLLPAASGVVFAKLSFAEQFDRVNKWPVLLEMKALAAKAASSSSKTISAGVDWKQHSSEVNKIVVKFISALTNPHQKYKYERMRQQEQQERDLMYQMLKDYFSKKHYQQQEQAWFAYFLIEKEGHRKRKVVEYLWTKCDAEADVNMAASIVMTLLSAASAASAGKPTAAGNSHEEEFSTMNNAEWLQRKKADRVRRHVLETVHACLISMQRQAVKKAVR